MSEKVFIKAPRLNPGDTVGLVAPSSPFTREKFDRGLELWENFFKLKFKYREDIFETEDYLAGNDERRLDEINGYLNDESLSGIFIIRGGYGCSRITSRVDWRALSQNPKVLCGFSDVTVFLNHSLRTSGVIPFHGLMPATTGGNDPNPFELDTLSKSLFEGIALGKIMDEKMSSLSDGEAEGRLIGGNLAMLTASIATPYEALFEDSILFLEDVNDPPRVIDRYLTQLRDSGKLDKVRGIVFGSFHERVMPDDWDSEESSAAYRRTIERCLKDHDIPVIWGFPAGHAENQPTFPLGIKVRMCAGEQNHLEFLEAGVS